MGRIQAERALGQLESGGGREKEGGGRRAHSPTSPSPAPVDRPDELSSPSEQLDPCALERESERQRPTEIQVSERGTEGGQRAQSRWEREVESGAHRSSGHPPRESWRKESRRRDREKEREEREKVGGPARRRRRRETERGRVVDGRESSTDARVRKPRRLSPIFGGRSDQAGPPLLCVRCDSII